MKRFVWKVVALMMFVSVLPLLASGLMIHNMFRRAVTEGFRGEVETSLDNAAAVHRNNVSLRRQVMALQTNQLAADPLLRELLGADTPDLNALQRLLQERADAMAFEDQAVAAITILPTGGGPAEHPPPPLAALDRRADYPADAWRSRDTAERLTTASGQTWEVRVTWVASWAIFDRFESLGKVKKYYTHLDNERAELSAAYTRTFFLLSGGVLVLTLVLALWWARATTRPLGMLADATARVGRGELDVQVPVQGRDEIAQLTLAFNAMVVELRAARERLAYLERVQAWQEIARRLAHEIKNPLTPILLAVQQLDRKFDDYLDRPQRYRKLLTDALEIVTEEVEGLRTLVREFSDFARLPEVKPTPAVVADFVHDVLRTNPQYEHRLDTPPVADSAAGARAGIDPAMLRRVLINLLDNAADANDAAQIEPAASIALRVEVAERHVVIAVEDRGTGIPAENAERIFEPYFTTKPHGTGLGLAIVRKIVIDHGGDIHALSPRPDTGQGTRMEVWLPRVVDAEAPLVS